MLPLLDDDAAPTAPLPVSRYRVTAFTPDGARSVEQQSIAAARALHRQWTAQGFAARIEAICVSPRSFAGEPGIVAHHLRREGWWVYALPDDLATCLLWAEQPDQEWNLLLERLAQRVQTQPKRCAWLRAEDPDLLQLLESPPIVVIESLDQADAVFRAIPLMGVMSRVPLHIAATWPKSCGGYG